MPLLQNDIDQLHGKEILNRYQQLKSSMKILMLLIVKIV